MSAAVKSLESPGGKPSQAGPVRGDAARSGQCRLTEGAGVMDTRGVPAGAPIARGHRPPFECIALLLQGGGALGAYQAGVYEALAEADLHPDWVAGISIGAINSAIIAGNSPQERVGRLRAFWEDVCANPFLDWAVASDDLAPRGDGARAFFNHMSATWSLFAGAAGFFTPRHLAPWLHPHGSLEATSFYDTRAL